MFKIFDRNHKQIDILENPYNAIITDELNGIGELKFTVPITYKKLQLEGYVQVKDGHEYVIKEITTEGRERNVHCVLNIEELLGMVHTTFTSKENNLNDTMMIILNGTTWTHVNNSTRTYTRNLYGTVVSSYHMLQLMSTVFDVEFYFDTHKKIVYIVDRVGEDNGTYFINDLNLKQLSQDTHTHNLITRVIPLGKDNLNISEVNGGKMWLENHTYSNKIIYGVWQATDYDNATHLKEDAQRYLDEMAIPYESYEIQVTDISKLANNPDFRYELGDVITIIDNLTETRIKQRICRKIYNLQDPDADIINIASKDRTFEDYYKRIQTIADMTDKVINTDGTINSEAIDKVPVDKIVGDIQATDIKADSITADHIKAEQIQAKHITADSISANHIKANSIQTNHLQANSITSGHIQADTINASHIQAGAITAGNGIIADGAIGNAQISNLDASKLTAGTIDTSDITIAGANQNLRITGNRLQVFEGIGTSQKERVSLGDVNADGSVYGIRVRGKDGTTVLFDDNGVTKEGITDGSITNDKINPNANINASKIDIDSVINRINEDGSTTIQGTRIDIDNKSLSAVISEINIKDSEQDETISSQASSITANTNAIKLKVDTQTYNTDKANMTSKLDKATSEISIMKNQIALKVEQSDIETANNTLKSEIQEDLNDINDRIDGILDDVGGAIADGLIDESETIMINSSITQLNKEKETLTQRYNYIYGLSTLAGSMKSSLKTMMDTYNTKQSALISHIQSMITDKRISDSERTTYNTRLTEYSTALANVNKKIEECVDSISTSKIDTAKAEIKVTTDAITQRVSSTESSTTTLTQKVNATVKDVKVYYAINTSSTTAPSSGWSTTPPTWENGKYIWSKTTTTLTNGTSTTTNPVCITGAKGDTGQTGAKGDKGDKGAKGDTGATGTGIESITTEYYLSTSKTTQTGGSWVTTQPTWSKGKYLWTRSKIIYKNPTSTAYTAPVCDSSWDVVNDVQKEVDANRTQISTTTNKVSAIETNLSNITSRVSSVETKTTSINDKVTSQESRLLSAESKITADAIISTVTSSSTYRDDLSGKVDTNSVVSSINQTAESIKINANKIQLEGATTVGSNNNYIKLNDYRYTAYVNNKLAMEFGGYLENGAFIPCLYMGANGFNASSSGRDGQYFALKNYGSYHHLTQRHSNGTWSVISFDENGNITYSPVGNSVFNSNVNFTKATNYENSLNINKGSSIYLNNTSNSTKAKLTYDKLAINKIGAYDTTNLAIESTIAPNVNDTVSIGTSSYKFKNLYGYNMYTDNIDLRYINSPVSTLYINQPQWGAFCPNRNEYQYLGLDANRWRTIYLYMSPNISSDARKKENIRYVNSEDYTTREDIITQANMYDFVKDELNIAEYNYLEEKKNTFGFIAQDLEKTKVGSSILTKDSEGFLAYDSGAYVSILAGALKETMNQVEQLKQEVAELKKAIQS